MNVKIAQACIDERLATGENSITNRVTQHHYETLRPTIYNGKQEVLLYSKSLEEKDHWGHKYTATLNPPTMICFNAYKLLHGIEAGMWNRIMTMLQEELGESNTPQAALGPPRGL